MAVCRRCQQSEAVHHATRVIHGVMHTTDLYADCFEVSAPQAVRDFTAMATQRGCFFCGGMSNVGGSEPIARALGIHRLRFFCFRCSRLYSLEVSRMLRTVPKDAPPDQRQGLLATLRDHVERRVRERITDV